MQTEMWSGATHRFNWTHTNTDDSNNNKTNNIDTNAQNVSINIDDSWFSVQL